MTLRKKISSTVSALAFLAVMALPMWGLFQVVAQAVANPVKAVETLIGLCMVAALMGLIIWGLQLDEQIGKEEQADFAGRCIYVFLAGFVLLEIGGAIVLWILAGILAAILAAILLVVGIKRLSKKYKQDMTAWRKRCGNRQKDRFKDQP